VTFRFIHSSDLHLGKRFGNFAGDLPGRLREGRHGVIARLAEHARQRGAATILLAGDTFDTETPAPEVRRQALAEMAHDASLRWVILPGNHDSLQAAQLWSTLRSEAPVNLTLAVEAQPLELAPSAMLLPAPCTTRRPGRDLTEWMGAQASPEGVLRIGLAHGAVQSFSEEGAGLDVIRPDRARLASLSYLALGDWHGGVEIDARTRYSGTPEPDRFKHNRPGEALLVTLDGPSAPPEVTPLPTGSFTWQTISLDLLEEEDPVARLEPLLPPLRDRRHALVRIAATGRSRLEGRAALAAAVDTATPDFAFLELDEAGLVTDCAPDDLDRIDRAGALREAADALFAESTDAGRSESERAVAKAALARLHAYAQAVLA
jgi:DNA repair exonuclease SbcCD nuclease subunit